MSRSGYDSDIDGWRHVRWRGAVASSIRGKRGQTLLRDMAEALDAMPVKELARNDFECGAGVCALGALGRARGIDLSRIDPEDSLTVAILFDIAEPLAREIVYENDEGNWRPETPGQRWVRMRCWTEGKIQA